MGKCMGRCEKVCWDVGKVREEVWGSVGEVWESVLGYGEGKERSGDRSGGRALNELMRSLTFRAHLLDCEGRRGKM